MGLYGLVEPKINLIAVFSAFKSDGMRRRLRGGLVVHSHITFPKGSDAALAGGSFELCIHSLVMLHAGTCAVYHPAKWLNFKAASTEWLGPASCNRKQEIHRDGLAITLFSRL